MKIHLQTVLFALCLTPLLAHAGGKAHVHGVATLDIAVEARKITVQLESPLDNLLGYERTPRTDAERPVHGADQPSVLDWVTRRPIAGPPHLSR